MRLNVATTIAVVAAAAILAMPVGAAPKSKRVIDAQGRTVLITKDEDGQTHTRIIIQKRSYLDPGTETFPGENTGFTGGHPFPPTQHATSVLDNTVTGTSQSSLPGPFTLPSKNNPWISD